MASKEACEQFNQVVELEDGFEEYLKNVQQSTSLQKLKEEGIDVFIWWLTTTYNLIKKDKK